MDPEITSTTPAPKPPPRRLRRVLAVAAGVAMVPALYAVASATTDSGHAPQVRSASTSADDPGTELEVEHGVVVEKPHGGATTPSVPETSTSTPTTTPTSAPAVTTPTTPEREVEHPVPEPGDDGNRGQGGGVATTAPSGSQTFTSVGGAITVVSNGTSISLGSSSPASGFFTEVHDNGPSRVEVRFTSGSGEWRIRVELAGGALTSEVSQHG